MRIETQNSLESGALVHNEQLIMNNEGLIMNN